MTRILRAVHFPNSDGPARLSDRQWGSVRGSNGLAFVRAVGLWVFGLSCLALACVDTSSVAPVRSANGSALTDGASVPQASAAQLPVVSGDAVWGRATAPVTVVTFVDLECPYCAALDATLAKLREKYGPERLRFVVKQFPLPFHAGAAPAARVARLVYESQGADAMLAFMTDVYSAHALDQGSLARAATRHGLDLAKVTDVEERRAETALARDRAAAVTAEVSAVPTLFVNGARVIGGETFEALSLVVEHELTAATELTRRGVASSDIYAQRVLSNYQPEEESDEPPAAAAGEGVALKVDITGAPALGPSDAWVTVVEFVDFECPFCARAHATIQQLVQENPGRLRWVVKHNPLPFHKRALPAAILANEVFRQKGSEAFFVVAGQLLEAKNLSDELFRRLAKEQKLDLLALDKALALGREQPHVAADQEQAEELLAEGTPHFFINGQRLAGARPIADFRQLVASEIKRAAELTPAPHTDVYAALQASAVAPAGSPLVAAPALGLSTPRLGDKSAKVTLQIFSDFECPYCGRLMGTLRQLAERYPDQIQFAWRHLPLAFHRRAEPAATASIAVRDELGDAAFWRYADQLFGLGDGGLGSLNGAKAALGNKAGSDPEQPEASALTDAALLSYAAQIGADPAKVKRALSNGAYKSQLEADARLASSLGIRGTPAVLVNNYLVVGAQPLRKFERLVKRCLTEQ